MLFVHTAGGGGFNEAAIIGHRIVEPEAAGEVIAVKAVSSQDAAGNVAAVSYTHLTLPTNEVV